MTLSFCSKVARPRESTRWLRSTPSEELKYDLVGLMEILYARKILNKVYSLWRRSGSDFAPHTISLMYTCAQLCTL